MIAIMNSRKWKYDRGKYMRLAREGIFIRALSK